AASSRSGSWRRGSSTTPRSRQPGTALPRKWRARSRRGARWVVSRLERPLEPSGGLVILKGNLAPGGCVVKMAGHERRMHRGPARVFDREEDAMAAVTRREINPGDVVVIRYEGPRGGRGMREMLGVAAALDDSVLRGHLARWRPRRRVPRAGSSRSTWRWCR